MKRFLLILISAPIAGLFAGTLDIGARNGATAPPPASPLVEVGLGGAPVRSLAVSYTIGDPTPEEQLYLEFINRARANPAAEAVLMASINDPAVLSAYEEFLLDLDLMKAQITPLASAQPLAMNSKLT